MNKRALIDKLQKRLNDLNSQIKDTEQEFDMTVLLGRRSELLSTMCIILDMPEEI